LQLEYFSVQEMPIRAVWVVHAGKVSLKKAKWWLKARSIRARYFLTSMFGTPVRLHMKLKCSEKKELYGMAVYLRPPQSSEGKSGLELLIQSIEVVKTLSPLWYNRFHRDINCFVLTDILAHNAYFLFDRTAFVNPWTASMVQDKDSIDVINAAFLIILFSGAYLARGRKGDLGICLEQKLAVNSAIRFLKKAIKIRPNVTYSLLIKELRMSHPSFAW
jgi:hypothetical protein